MESKKMMIVINHEEEHLALKSVKTKEKRVKKIAKSELDSPTDTKNEELESLKKKSEEVLESKHKAESETESEAIFEETRSKDGSSSVNSSNDSKVIQKKKNKTKKSKKCEYDNQNISVKSSFNKFDALQKRNLIHVRSSDSSKAQEIFSNLQDEHQRTCRQCSKPVYKMEEVIVKFKNDNGIYHKTCLRCKDCAKQLKFDNYQSHEGNLYCNVHFKLLFAPKVVEQDEEPTPRKAELIIRESQPVELPPDVVRASDKPNLGLDELQQLNVRSRFELFENVGQNKLKEEKMITQERPVKKRNTSVLTKYCQKTVDNEHDGSGNKSDYESGEEHEDSDLIRSKKNTQKERPVGLGDAINDIKTRFERGTIQSKEDRREERKQEIQNIRSRLFMGKQAKIKEMYQQAVAESEQSITSVGKQPDVEFSAAARSIKERFEKGEMFNDKDPASTSSNGLNGHTSGLSEDADVFESAIAKKSRSIFMELDANMASNMNTLRDSQKLTPILTSLQKCSSHNQLQAENMDLDVVKCGAQAEDVKATTAELTQKFKFFETYRPKDGEKRQFRITPPREGVVKMPSPDSDIETDSNVKHNFHDNILQKTQTTSQMLNKFREMEQNKSLQSTQSFTNPRPLKCFTPPPEDRRSYCDRTDSEDEEDEDEEEEEETEDDKSEIDKEVLRFSTTSGDEALKEAQRAARAKQLRQKFEKWQANEIKREMVEGYVDIYSQQVSDDSTIESAKAIRERFENLQHVERASPAIPRYQVNRFV